MTVSRPILTRRSIWVFCLTCLFTLSGNPLLTPCVWFLIIAGVGILVNLRLVSYFNPVIFASFKNIGFYMSNLIFSILILISYQLMLAVWIVLSFFMVDLLAAVLFYSEVPFLHTFLILIPLPGDFVLPSYAIIVAPPLS